MIFSVWGQCFFLFLFFVTCIFVGSSDIQFVFTFQTDFPPLWVCHNDINLFAEDPYKCLTGFIRWLNICNFAPVCCMETWWLHSAANNGIAALRVSGCQRVCLKEPLMFLKSVSLPLFIKEHVFLEMWSEAHFCHLNSICLIFSVNAWCVDAILWDVSCIRCWHQTKGVYEALT